MSGQIDIEYLKPEDPQGVAINAYVDSELKVEANAGANFHLSPRLNTEVLAHFEDRYMNHGGNDDGFADTPDIRQFNLQNRWDYFSDSYIFHGGLGAINEKSDAGKYPTAMTGMQPAAPPAILSMRLNSALSVMKPT